MQSNWNQFATFLSKIANIVGDNIILKNQKITKNLRVAMLPGYMKLNTEKIYREAYADGSIEIMLPSQSTASNLVSSTSFIS